MDQEEVEETGMKLRYTTEDQWMLRILPEDRYWIQEFNRLTTYFLLVIKNPCFCMG